ncbi:SDR family NAD(P)-dependent oxidoreductase [Mesorhizobium sp. LjNodule214]|uniref:SDR family NAD(P)-dependent oxidoreductase n=1 Tax=Mesorhizobium sp. LjNodule214 TaxID=3342252 RepID=UPI003F500DB7
MVTGGGRGIGLACADALGEAGARLVIIEPDEQIDSAGKDALTAKGYSAELMLGDVTSSAGMTEIADN